MLGRADLIASGISLYDRDIRIAENVDFSADRDGNGDLVVHMTTGGNYIEATCTQPTDLGKWADPRFSFAFGLDLTYRIDLPPLTKPLSSTGFQSIRILAPTIDSHGIVADLVFVVNDVVRWFSGTDFIKMLENFIAETDFASYANQALAGVNATLTELASQGYYFLESVIDRLDGGSDLLHGLSLPGAPVDRLELLLTCSGFDRSGVITGEVHWPRTLGEPTNRPRLEVGTVISEVVRDFGAATVAQIVSAPAGEWRAVDALSFPGIIPEEELSPTPVAEKLAVLAPQVAVELSTDLRAGAASRFVSLIGEATFNALRLEFLHGREDLSFLVTTPVGGEGLFADQKVVGQLATLWEADDVVTCRRRFTLVDVATDAPISVNVLLANGYRWAGEVESVAAVPDGWSGTITVRKDDGKVRQAFDDHVVLNLDGVRHFGLRDQLAEQGVIVVGDRLRPLRLGDEVTPNPLPPRDQTIPAAADPIHAGGFHLNPSALKLETGQAVGRFGQEALKVEELHIDRETLRLVRENPSGSGTVTGINFDIKESAEQVIR
jgi:hypothetical protein